MSADDLHNGWTLTTDHAASSYGQPVLVSPEREAYGTADLLTAAQVAQMRGVEPRTIQDQMRRGRIPARKLAGVWVATAADALVGYGRGPGRDRHEGAGR